MIAELISVGTELLLGNIVNTNTRFLAEKCALLGISMYHQVVVGDNRERLAEVIRTALGRADLIILSGGLGPTEDDITKEVCAEVMEAPLMEDPHTRARIEEYFRDGIYRVIPDNNWKQAMIPAGAIVLDNDNGTAPGLIMEKGGRAAILLPGPPNELYPMFINRVAPYLERQQPELIRSCMVKICGMGESQVEDRLLDLIDSQTNPTIATYAKTGEVHIRVTARAANEAAAKDLMRPSVDEIRARFGSSVYSEQEDETLEMAVVALLKKHQLTVVTAESCTGGMLSARLVNVSGASEVFQEGYVTYSNEAKEKLLQVRAATLARYGAVSEQTAAEMAQGAAGTAGAAAAVVITGIAGPDGGTAEKPVGLVYIGICLNGKMATERCHFKGNREKIREQATVRALSLLRLQILEEYKD